MNNQAIIAAANAAALINPLDESRKSARVQKGPLRHRMKYIRLI